MKVNVLKDITWANRDVSLPNISVKSGINDLPEWLANRMLETGFAKEIIVLKQIKPAVENKMIDTAKMQNKSKPKVAKKKKPAKKTKSGE